MAAHSSWDRFQGLLEGLQPGDELHVATAVRETGLSADACKRVLEALARAHLFTRVGDHAFLRRRMSQVMQQLDA